MTRLVKVSGRGDGTDWKSALKDLQPDSHNLPFEELKYFNDPKNETYYFICRSGDLSYYACQTLKSKGYKHLININDGILNWKGKIQSLT